MFVVSTGRKPSSVKTVGSDVKVPVFLVTFKTVGSDVKVPVFLVTFKTVGSGVKVPAFLVTFKLDVVIADRMNAS